MKTSGLSLGALRAGILLALSSPVFASPYSEMIVFGDSLSDNGNLASVAPGILASLNYDASRVTNGPSTSPATSLVGVTVEQLNFKLGLPPLVPALLGGTNYAWAFGTTATNGLDLANLVTPGTGAQVGAYLSTHPVASPDALYVIWAGANDLIGATTPAAIAAAETQAMANLTGQVGSLLASGAKNILWFNLPDLSLTPRGFLAGPTLNAQLHLSSEQFRTDWATSIAQLSALFPSASITGVDTYSVFTSILSNPSSYGFTQAGLPAQGAAGANPDEYVFWDTLHPTTKAHSILAEYAFQQLPAAAPVPDMGGHFELAAALFALVLLQMYSTRSRSATSAAA